MTLNKKILQLPSEQKSWLLLIKNTLKRTFNSNIENKREFINALESKAIEKGYREIGLFLNSNDLEEYIKN
ncbi:MAG: hypothetical protein ABFR32_13605 [Bacteroidota bacterium]